jgi:hypothetical protein
MGYDLLRRSGYEVVDLAKTKTISVPVPGGAVWSTLDTFELSMSADVVISLPVLKTHCQAYVTLGLKNMMGLASSEQKPAFHLQGLYASLCDINAVYRPSFAVVDGIIGQEGLGPTAGYPVHANIVVAGSDLVAVDAVCARAMGFDPSEVPLLPMAARRGLGTLDPEAIDLTGAPLSSVERRFLRAEEDPRAPTEGEALIQGDEPCLGCRNSVAAAYLMLEKADERVLAQGITFACGRALLGERCDSGNAIAVGRCALTGTQELPHFVPGCPPRSADIVAAVRRLAQME